MSDDIIGKFLALQEEGKRRRDFEPKSFEGELPLIRGIPGTLSLLRSPLLIHYETGRESYCSYHKDLSATEALTKARDVALAARAADKSIMLGISSKLIEDAKATLPCEKCREIRFRVDNVRKHLFPEIDRLRKAVHHKDEGVLHAMDSNSSGTASLNYKACFDYYHLVFTSLIPISFGDEWTAELGIFKMHRCKECRKQLKRSDNL